MIVRIPALGAPSPSQLVPRVLDYHERTRLDPDRSSPSGKVAANHVRHGGATRVNLARPDPEDDPGPSFDALFTRAVASRRVDATNLGGFLFDALALSARQKGPGGWRRRLRVFPSLGGAYPTQAHLVVGPDAGLAPLAGVFHYEPLDHVLERRRALLDGDWAAIAEPLPAGAFLVGLSTLPSRLVPVSADRALRDAHLEIGHALAAVAWSAAVRGWQTRGIDTVADAHLARLFALDRRLGQVPAALLAVFPGSDVVGPPMLGIPAELLDRLATEEPEGRTNLRPPTADPVPEIVASTVYGGHGQGSLEVESNDPPAGPEIDRDLEARSILRSRRHAHAFDSEVGVDRSLFLHLLRRVVPDASAVPWQMLPWRARVAALVFVHRVQGFEEGIYLLARHAEHAASLRQAATRDSLEWDAVEADGLELYRLRVAEVRESAELICCHQTTAADGAFTVVLLAEMEPSLRWHGPWFYPRLFWEAGAVAHALALEAEAADLSASFLGRFHDSLVHLLLGFESPAWRAAYAVAVGERLDDPRVETLPAYRDTLRG